MWKKALMGTLAVVLIVAVAYSIYNVMGAQASTQAAVVAGNGNNPTPGNGQGAGTANQNQNGARPQAPATNAAPANQTNAAPANQTNAAPANQTSTGQGNSQAVQGGQRGQGAMTGGGVPDPQNGLGEWETLQGTVSAFAAPDFVLVTTDGQNIPVQLGNLNYLNRIGLTLVDGDNVTLVGAYESTGSMAVQSITVNGQTYDLRNATGRPLWAGRGSK